MKPFVPGVLPPLELQWEPLISLISQANRSIARFDGTLQGLPNPKILLTPMTTQEAVLSSRIEGTQATLGDVLKNEAGDEPEREETRQDIQEILNYRKAIGTADNALKQKPFHLNFLKSMHAVLMDSVRGRTKTPGEFRRHQNHIGRPGSTIDQAEFVPPVPESVPDLMGAWEKYYHAEEHDLLVQAALVHAQFEIIHPFADGNGRLGRMVVTLFLYERRVLSQPIFYMSAYLEKNRDEYIERLRALRDPGHWNAWVEFFLRALDYQAQQNADTAKKIMDLYARKKAELLNLTRSQYAVPLLDHIFEQPVFQASALSRRKGMPSVPAVTGMLNKLKKSGNLKVLRAGAGRRPQILAFSELVNLCEGKKVL